MEKCNVVLLRAIGARIISTNLQRMRTIEAMIKKTSWEWVEPAWEEAERLGILQRTKISTDHNSSNSTNMRSSQDLRGRSGKPKKLLQNSNNNIITKELRQQILITREMSRVRSEDVVDMAKK